MNVASIRFLLPPIVAIIMSINMSDNLVVNLTDSSDILVVNSTESPSHERHFWPFRTFLLIVTYFNKICHPFFKFTQNDTISSILWMHNIRSYYVEKSVLQKIQRR
ncbi:hypothetical protein EWB00_005306 [Schistosoma japonicum]|uniref:Uncharacterized protein n=1 Tax=Schistosoma japonicum TaxID=6182 RepID=A0A4Z2D1Y3_SCHJA|nr:hypothetical protein EWB00_005306 [Schistosoma japonicum]